MRSSAQTGIGCSYLEVPEVRARLWAAWTDRGLSCLHWAQPGDGPDAAFGPGHPREETLPEPLAKVLRAYLAGEGVDPTVLPIDPEGTQFQRKVWSALRRIPRGDVRSYASVANDVGSPRGMRAVGAANGRNPIAIVVPCHRVVEAGLRIGGYSGGLHLKRFLLELEGVKVVGDRVQPGQLELM